MIEVRPTFCRICNKLCPIEAHVEDGRLVKVTGDKANPIYDGYTCVKGREMPTFVNSPDRFLRSQRRRPDGALEPIPVAQAMDEIAEQLRRIIDEHGPRAVAAYTGTQSQNPAAIPMLTSLLRGIGSPMQFAALTVDKPGRTLAWTMLGRWMAPHQNFHDPKVALMIGINPFVNGLGGVPQGPPGKWLSDRLADGMDLIVIDPRRSDIAKRATIFLQPRPGHDIPLLAAMLNVILREARHDAAFVAEHVRGLDALAEVVGAFDPTEVARRADVDADDLVTAARRFADAGRGYVVAGTGPHMAASGTVLEYLALCLDTVCGHWMRAGEEVRTAGVLVAPLQPKEQAADPQPAYGYGERSRVRGLGMGAAGMPSATLADEILLDGPGRVRALITCGGNPVVAIPDQRKTIEAMRSLDLLVAVDPWPSQTAEHATYVIAPKLPLEMSATTQKVEGVMRSTYATAYGYLDDYAQHTGPVVDPPPGAEVIEDWELFYGLGQRLGIDLSLSTTGGGTVALDMTTAPTPDELLAIMCTGSRVPLEEVRRHPHGALFPADPPIVVAPKDEGWEGRLDVGNEDMLTDLRTAAGPSTAVDGDLPFRLLVRRMMHVVNSSYNTGTAHGYRNPAFLHPDDLVAIGAEPGDIVTIRSAHDSVPAVAAADASLRRGTVSIAFGFGRGPEHDHLVREIGSNVGRLLRNDDDFERYSGQPRQSNVPVAVCLAGPAPS
ncbi:MAG: anaerobic dehydrogenase [Actinomycetia bacterium]|nr:anaerobic dehydrogenase [Actinomycetes bacterium]